MMLNVIAIKDRAADAFMMPSFFPTEAMAIRSFKEEVTKAESPVAKNPSDYDLYWLGMFDDGKGIFHCEAARLLCRAEDVQKANVLQLRKEVK